MTVTSGLRNSKAPPQKTVRVIRNRDLERLAASSIAESEVNTKAFERCKLAPGDILLEVSGGSDTLTVGRVGFFNMTDGEYTCSRFLSRLRVANEAIDPRYLFHLLHHFHTMGGTVPLERVGKGMMKNLDLEGYLATEIPLPPMEVQRKIVAAIEAGQADALEKYL